MHTKKIKNNIKSNKHTANSYGLNDVINGIDENTKSYKFLLIGFLAFMVFVIIPLFNTGLLFYVIKLLSNN